MKSPVSLLKEDHRKVKGLFRQFQRTESKAQLQKIGQQIVEELSVHAGIEEQLVYPMLRKRQENLEEPVLNALEEHHSVKLILAELDGMKADDERYCAKMHVVQESVEMHIEEEEEKLLPRIDKLLDSEEKKKLADAIVAAKKVVPNHPHPSASDTPPTGMVSGLFAKMADAGKDFVRGLTSADKSAGHRRAKAGAKSQAAMHARTRGHTRKAARR